MLNRQLCMGWLKKAKESEKRCQSASDCDCGRNARSVGGDPNRILALEERQGAFRVGSSKAD